MIELIDDKCKTLVGYLAQIGAFGEVLTTRSCPFTQVAVFTRQKCGETSGLVPDRKSTNRTRTRPGLHGLSATLVATGSRHWLAARSGHLKGRLYFKSVARAAHNYSGDFGNYALEKPKRAAR